MLENIVKLLQNSEVLRFWVAGSKFGQLAIFDSAQPIFFRFD